MGIYKGPTKKVGFGSLRYTSGFRVLQGPGSSWVEGSWIQAAVQFGCVLGLFAALWDHINPNSIYKASYTVVMLMPFMCFCADMPNVAVKHEL